MQWAGKFQRDGEPCTCSLSSARELSARCTPAPPVAMRTRISKLVLPRVADVVLAQRRERLQQEGALLRRAARHKHLCGQARMGLAACARIHSLHNMTAPQHDCVYGYQKLGSCALQGWDVIVHGAGKGSSIWMRYMTHLAAAVECDARGGQAPRRRWRSG